MITSYNELPLGRYDDIIRIVGEGRDDLGLNIGIVAALCGITEEEVGEMPAEDFFALCRKATFITTPPNVPTFAKPADGLIVGKFHLVPVKDIRAITTAQYIDFQNFLKLDGPHDAELLSCLLVPTGCKYNDGYDVLEVQKAIRERMSVTTAYALINYFFALSKRSIGNTLASSAKMMRRVARKEKDKEKARLSKAMRRLSRLCSRGDGSPMWTPSPILPDLVSTKSSTSPSSSSSTTSATTPTRRTRESRRRNDGSARTKTTPKTTPKQPPR